MCDDMVTILMLSAVLDKGCTTLMVADSMARCQVLGHTEDGPPEAEDCMAMLEVTIPATEHLERGRVLHRAQLPRVPGGPRPGLQQQRGLCLEHEQHHAQEPRPWNT